MMTRYGRFLSLLLLSACAAPEGTPREQGPDAQTISLIVENLYSKDASRRAVAAALVEDVGPAGGPVLRAMLTRRSGPADPFVADLIAALGEDEKVLVGAACEQLLLRDGRVVPDLWEAMLMTESPKLALHALELLTRKVGAPRVRAAIEALRIWGAGPRVLAGGSAFPVPSERLYTSVHDEGGDLTQPGRFARPTEDATMREFLQEIESAERLQPIEPVQDVREYR
jgi:hypothetical protein